MARELGSARVSKWEGKRRIRVRVLDVVHLVERDFRVLELVVWCRVRLEKRNERSVQVRVNCDA